MTKKKNQNKNKIKVKKDLPVPQGFKINSSTNNSYLTEILSEIDNVNGNIHPDDPPAAPPMGFAFMDDGNYGSSEQVSFERTANQSMNLSSAIPQTSRVPLMYIDPLFDPVLMLFPIGDIQALNERLRHYYNHHPLVGNILDLHSFHPDTLILTKDGLKKITDCNDGDYILSDLGEYQKVLEKGSHFSNRKMIRISPFCLSSVDVTDNHPVWRLKGIRYRDTQGKEKVYCRGSWKPDYKSGEWVMAKDLNEGDFVVYPKIKTETNFNDIDLSKYVSSKFLLFDENYIWDKRYPDKKQHRFIKVNEELSELFGWYCTEGGINANMRNACFTVSLEEKEEINRIKFLMKKIFNLDCKTKKYKNCYRNYVNSRIFCEFAKNVAGRGSHNKKIPYFILEGTKENAVSFLKAAVLGDGTLKSGKKSKRMTYDTVSKEMALQFQILSAKVGFLISCNINSSHSSKLGGSLRKYRQAVLKEETKFNWNDRRLTYFEDEDNFYCPIRSIKEYNYEGLVWDLKTETKTILAPFKVHNSEFPLSDFSLETGDPAITRFYNSFKDKIGLLNLLVGMNKEYWLLGEVFRYGNWNQYYGMWESFVPLAPERVEVYSTYLTDSNLFYLKPDPDIKKKLSSNDPKDEAILRHTDPNYLQAVRENRSFRLDNNRLIYMARKGPGDKRGTTIMRRILKDLIYEDKLRMLQYTFVDRSLFPITLIKLGSEQHGWIPPQSHFDSFRQQLMQACFSEDTEILTENGFKYHWEIKEDDKLATLNPETNEMFYEKPAQKFLYDYGETSEKKKINQEEIDNVKNIAIKTAKSRTYIPYEILDCDKELIEIFWLTYVDYRKIYERDNSNLKEIRIRNKELSQLLYSVLFKLNKRVKIKEYKSGKYLVYILQYKEISDKMFNFKTQVIDLMVTPNHKMLVDNQRGTYKKRADEVVIGDAFRTTAYWDGEEPKYIKISNNLYDAKAMLTLMGFIISEGNIDLKNRRIVISQKADNHYFDKKIKDVFKKLNIGFKEKIRENDSVLRGYEVKSIMKIYTIHNVELTKWFATHCGEGSLNKRIPLFAKKYSKRYLKILFEALMDGDGNIYHANDEIIRKNGDTHKMDVDRYTYYTSSIQLARDIQELMLKMGWTSICRKRKHEHPRKKDIILESFVIRCAPKRKVNCRSNPVIYKKHQIKEVDYKGKVFCYRLPTYGTLMARRNGRIAWTFNSGDPSYNILYHWGVSVDYISPRDKIENLIPHFEWVEKRIMAGLFANDALVHGQASTYAASANSTRILMHRYLTQRALIEQMTKYQMFLPMAKVHGFVKRTKAELDHKVRTSPKEYILPKYVWQKLNLLSNTVQQQMIATLRQNDEIPFRYVADLFGWDARDVEEALKAEKGTMLDKNYRKLREEKEAEYSEEFLKGQGIRNLLVRTKEKEEEDKQLDLGIYKEKSLPKSEIPKEEKEELPKELGAPEVE